MVSLKVVLSLMVLMAIKHFCADFLFQTSAIARGKAAEKGWLAPLCLHAAGHAAITLIIALVAYPGLWWIAPIEFVVHAGIDRSKVLVGRGTKLEPTNTRYWWLFGFDQLLHGFTNIAIIGAFLAAS